MIELPFANKPQRQNKPKLLTHLYSKGVPERKEKFLEILWEVGEIHQLQADGDQDER